MINHFLHPARNDFMEMFLHHVVTLLLYGFSYMVRFTQVGAVVMYLHDLSDIFATLVRCVTETTSFVVIIPSALMMLFSWFFTRIYVFPQVIMKGCFTIDIYQGNDFIGTRFFGYLLSILFVMHIYWFAIMLRSVKRYFKTGRADDLHQRIEKKQDGPQ